MFLVVPWDCVVSPSRWTSRLDAMLIPTYSLSLTEPIIQSSTDLSEPSTYLFIYLLHIFCRFSFMSLMITFCMDYWFLLDNYNNVYERKHTHKQEYVCMCVCVCACEISACRSEKGIGSLRIGELGISEPPHLGAGRSSVKTESVLNHWVNSRTGVLS